MFRIATNIIQRNIIKGDGSVMKILDEIVQMFCGKYDNNKQHLLEEKNANINNIKAHYVNAICNHKIINLPNNFLNYFVIEECYYEANGKVTTLSHLFLLDVNEEGKIRLTSYKIPCDYKKEKFTNTNVSLKFDFKDLIK